MTASYLLHPKQGCIDGMRYLSLYQIIVMRSINNLIDNSTRGNIGSIISMLAYNNHMKIYKIGSCFKYSMVWPCGVRLKLILVVGVYCTHDMHKILCAYILHTNNMGVYWQNKYDDIQQLTIIIRYMRSKMKPILVDSTKCSHDMHKNNFIQYVQMLYK